MKGNIDAMSDAYVLTTDHRERSVSYRRRYMEVIPRSKCMQFVICLGKIKYPSILQTVVSMPLC
jgi:hypothetical protein